MKPEILIAIITGSISLFGVIITAWLNYKAKLLEIQMKSDKPLPKKRRKNTIWFIIFGIILLGSGIYFLIQRPNISNGDIIWETDTTGYFIDQRDQHKYNVVKIGEQIWMAENLAYLPQICPPTDECGCWVYGYYGNDILEAKEFSNYKKFGCMYNMENVLNGNICPNGWSIPTQQEFEFLLNTFVNKNKTPYFSLVEADNNVFSIRLGGRRNSKSKFYDLHYLTAFWTASQNNEKSLVGITFNNYRKDISFGNYTDDSNNYNWGLYIRCIKSTK